MFYKLKEDNVRVVNLDELQEIGEDDDKSPFGDKKVLIKYIQALNQHYSTHQVLCLRADIIFRIAYTISKD